MSVTQAYGANIAFIEELYERYRANPESVSASWREVFVWDAGTGQLIKTLDRFPGTIWSVAFSPDGRRLAAGGGYKGKGEIKVWDATLWTKKPAQP